MALPVVVVESFNGVDLQTATLRAFFREEDKVFARNVAPTYSRPTGGYPRATAYEHKERTAPVHVQVAVGSERTGAEALMQTFRPGATGPLVVSVDGANRVLDCLVRQPMQYEAHLQVFTAVLEAPDPRWRSEALHTTTVAVTASPTSATVTPDATGTLVDDPIITITPQTPKAATAGHQYRERIIIANRSTRAMPSQPICVTAAGWDHATEVAAGRSQADGDDVRLRVNGVEVAYWNDTNASYTWNTATLKLFANLSLPAGRGAVLLANITDTVPANGGDLEVVNGDTAQFPATGGAIVLDDECFTYTGITERNASNRAAFTGITRGARNTTAASHTAGTPGTPNIWLLDYDVELMHGDTDATVQDAHNEQKPHLDFTDGTLANTKHVQNSTSGFLHDTQPRTRQWTRGLTAARDDQSGQIVATGGSPATSLASLYYAAGAQAGKQNANEWRLEIPEGIEQGATKITYVRTQAAELGIQVIGIDGEGNEVVLANHVGAASAASASVSPGAVLYALIFYVFNTVIWKRPAAGDLTIYTTLSGTATANGVRFKTGSQPVTLNGCAVYVADNGTARTLTAAIYSDDGAATPAPSQAVAGLSGTVDTDGLGPGNNATLSVAFTTPKDLAPSTYYWLVLSQTVGADVLWSRAYPQHVNLSGEQDSVRQAGTSTNNPGYTLDLILYGYKSALASEVVRLDLTSLATDAATASVTSVTLVLNAATVPYVKMAAREAVYHVNGVLLNATTGQSATLDYVCPLGAQLEIDVGVRSVTNLTTGERIDNAVVWSDRDGWIGLVAGANSMTWTETAAVGVAIDIDYYDRWN